MSDDIEQGSDAWHELKIGHVGSSMLHCVLAEGKTKGSPSATREDYMVTLLTERITGKWDEDFYSRWMERGKELEPIARSEYEARMGVMVIQDKGREHKDLHDWWSSPDGLVNLDGMTEFKCPKPKNHLNTVLKGIVKRDYLLQMAGGVTIYEREYCDFVSFCPTFPENLQFYRKRFYRKDLPIDEVLKAVPIFIDELNALESKVKALGSTIPA